MQSVNKDKVREFLEFKFRQYSRPDFIPLDPVSIPHIFSTKEDIEIAGFLVASISWGQRKTILGSARRILNLMDNEPHHFILNASDKDFNPFRNIVHRTFNGTDCIYFLKALQNIYQNHGGMENCFRAENIREGILKYRRIFFELDHPKRTEKHLADPAANSAAKRLNMFLRWMVRKDHSGIDFGIWKIFSPSQLYCPLDVHSGNVARKLGLLQRKQNDWRAVEELTENLRKFDPLDPVKYDIALFALGIEENY